MEQSISLLFIEDDRIDQMAYQALMRDELTGYQYTIVASIAEAHSWLENYTFDIVISDFTLGDGTAMDLLRTYAHIPMIIITGDGSESVAVEAMKAGAYDYLSKDTHRTYLHLLPVVIENVLKRIHAEQESRKLLHERIRRETLQQFIRDASHDLRTSLTTLNTSIYLLHRNIQAIMPLLKNQPVDVNTLYSQIIRLDERGQQVASYKGHLERIILDMLEQVRIDNLDHLERIPLSIDALVNQVVTSQMVMAQHKGITLTFVPSSPELMVSASVAEMQIVLRNLLSNAITYTPPNGTIEVSTALVGSSAVIRIQDTGIGIPPEQLNRIFDRFYRVNPARTMTESGSGLGLSIARQIMDLHNGQIEVASTLGQGSAFTLILPAIL